jgi:hypothetical protein
VFWRRSLFLLHDGPIFGSRNRDTGGRTRRPRREGEARCPPREAAGALRFECLLRWGTPTVEEERVTSSSDDIPIIEEPDPLDPEDAAEVAPLDSEIDFDDEQDEDQLPLDETEAAEAGVLLDDPEALSDEDE